MADTYNQCLSIIAELSHAGQNTCLNDNTLFYSLFLLVITSNTKLQKGEKSWSCPFFLDIRNVMFFNGREVVLGR